MSREVHFEMGYPDPEKAAAFCRDVFEWNMQKGPGGIMRRQDGQPRTVDTCVQEITDHGGTVVLPQMAVPGVGCQSDPAATQRGRARRPD